MSLFEETKPPKPLAERMRPKSLDEVLGQSEAMRLLRAFVERGEMTSLVFSGPPGSGKTTMSRLLASLLGWEGRSLNATSGSVKDIREIAAEAKSLWRQLEKRTLLFIDEIHRLNKGQQDVLLPILEEGTLILAGSTTENPYFALNQALRSRVQLIQLDPLSLEEIKTGLDRACGAEGIAMEPDARDWVAERVSGDLRLAYTVLESAALLADDADRPVGLSEVRPCLSRARLAGDRKGDNHFDLASAFQKSLRGSDVNAAVYYLARFLETGEDPRFIARRLLVTASEDVGNADPRALTVAANAFRSVEVLGMPECRIPLAQAAIYVAGAPKSNQSIKALDSAVHLLRDRPLDPIPDHLRDAHYAGAAKRGHGVDYVYSHDQPDVPQQFLPDGIKDRVFVTEPDGAEAPTPEELDRLSEWIGANASHGWFELDARDIAEKLGWTVARVRNGVNLLVRLKKLSFRRQFKTGEDEA